MNYVITYRNKLGFSNPPDNTIVEIKFMEGLKFYILIDNCIDNENILEAYFPTYKKALEYLVNNFPTYKIKCEPQ